MAVEINRGWERNPEGDSFTVAIGTRVVDAMNVQQKPIELSPNKPVSVRRQRLGH